MEKLSNLTLLLVISGIVLGLAYLAKTTKAAPPTDNTSTTGTAGTGPTTLTKSAAINVVVNHLETLKLASQGAFT